ncbi:MAG TPA: hypothetical protein VI138_01055 [Candidatus Dormibacteraeota bacterium]
MAAAKAVGAGLRERLLAGGEHRLHAGCPDWAIMLHQVGAVLAEAVDLPARALAWPRYALACAKARVGCLEGASDQVAMALTASPDLLPSAVRDPDLDPAPAFPGWPERPA